MMRLLLLGLCLLAPAVGCSRHVVVERDAGRVDGQRSITTMSDDEWTVRDEPAPGGLDEDAWR